MFGLEIVVVISNCSLMCLSEWANAILNSKYCLLSTLANEEQWDSRAYLKGTDEMLEES